MPHAQAAAKAHFVYDAPLLREILDAQLEMVCRFRRDGTILFVNRAYAETLGSTPAELTGNNLWQYVSAADRAHVEAQSSGFDITERKQLEEQRQLLIDELNHRVRNTLTVVQGMAFQSFRTELVTEDALETFNARLHALAAAHTVLSQTNWSGAEIGHIVGQALAICGEGSGRVVVTGSPATIRPATAVALSLVLHELATNALKHGALAGVAGQVAVGWTVAERRLGLTWHEHGGPAVRPPGRRGFGSRLLESTVRGQLAGELEIDYAPAGLRCRIAIPLDPLPTAS